MALIIQGVSSPSTRSQFDHDLQSIREDILRLGSLVEEQIRHSVRSLRDRNLALGREVIAADTRVNALRYKIEENCLRVIARQQPAARDLRMIIAATHMASELERIGDHAAGIATISVRIGEGPLIKPLIDIPRMQDIVCDMVHRALDAYVHLDAPVSQQVAAMDDQVDELYSQILRELLTYMMQDAKTLNSAMYLLWVAHNLERIGDRATNLCERVIFAATGALGDYKTFQPRDE